ncbi:hypothetical protein EIN_336810 [Entamoeba invadens IP1]|uniref:Uncharacterized protein n=1 Tax=Entamoeba invadens IP1 TaxID=370355 RepID=L7FNU9_ENTIV|nr:hypothetical protein EIN_336810 [Entamoeba invadens IP1]ELP92559.1 hypothetical protein EIN_336810 [Entamoeba invadens IP1]|eukprot:XP_004259330.1 hypothetical protein EIN_336810 [Entamoeba invadens IP1]
MIYSNKTSHTFFFFLFINVLVQPITVAVDSNIIARLYDIFKSIPFYLLSTMTPETLKGIPPLNSKFIKSLVLQPIVLSISLNLQPNQLVFSSYNAATAFLYAFGSLLVNIRKSSIKLNTSIAKNINSDTVDINIDNIKGSLKHVFIELQANHEPSHHLLCKFFVWGNPQGLPKDIST